MIVFLVYVVQGRLLGLSISIIVALFRSPCHNHGAHVLIHQQRMSLFVRYLSI